MANSSGDRYLPQDITMHVHFHFDGQPTPEALRACVEAARIDLTAPSDSVAHGRSDPGADQYLLAVRSAYTDSYAKAKALLDFLADHPGRWIPFPEVNAALGFSSNRSLPGALGAFGRRAAHRYAGIKPFEARQSDGVWQLRMSTEAAAIIDELR